MILNLVNFANHSHSIRVTIVPLSFISSSFTRSLNSSSINGKHTCLPFSSVLNTISPSSSFRATTAPTSSFSSASSTFFSSSLIILSTSFTFSPVLLCAFTSSKYISRYLFKYSFAASLCALYAPFTCACATRTDL